MEDGRVTKIVLVGVNIDGIVSDLVLLVEKTVKPMIRDMEAERKESRVSWKAKKDKGRYNTQKQRHTQPKRSYRR